MHNSFCDKINKTEFTNSISTAKAGGIATLAQITSLMWLKTTINYQSYHGGSISDVVKNLYRDGGVRRFYKGIGMTMIHAPLCRFGDIFSNNLIISKMNSNDTTKNLSIGTKTFCGSIGAGVWRIGLMPIETLKNSMQINGTHGLKIITDTVREKGIGRLYHGSFATFTTTLMSHYPWFMTYNSLDMYFDKNYKNLSNKQTLAKNAFLGFGASIVSDTLCNSVQVVKVIRQTQKQDLGYVDIIRGVIQKDGLYGLFVRSLPTRLFLNGVQGMLFSVVWKYYQ